MEIKGWLKLAADELVVQSAAPWHTICLKFSRDLRTIMNPTNLIALFGLTLALPAAFAEGSTTPPTPFAEPLSESAQDHAARKGDSILTVQPPPIEAVELPAKEGQEELQTQVKDLVQKFKEEREALLKQQAEKKGDLKEERKEIRDQLAARRDAFLEAQRQAREEMQTKFDSLKETLKNHRDVIDAAKEGVRDFRKGGAP